MRLLGFFTCNFRNSVLISDYLFAFTSASIRNLFIIFRLVLVAKTLSHGLGIELVFDQKADKTC